MGWPPSDTAAPQPLLAAGQPTVTRRRQDDHVQDQAEHPLQPAAGRGRRLEQAGRLAGRQVRDRARAHARSPERLPDSVLRRPAVGSRQAQAAVKKDPTKAPNISGITTPDSSTIVFQLTKPSAIGVIDALSLPLSSPVPQGYAAKYDSKTPSSTYGEHQIDVGPYYIANYSARQADRAAAQPELHRRFRLPPGLRGQGRGPGGVRGHELGGAARSSPGRSMVNFDFSATGQSLKVAATQYPKQLSADAERR